MALAFGLPDGLRLGEHKVFAVRGGMCRMCFDASVGGLLRLASQCGIVYRKMIKNSFSPDFITFHHSNLNSTATRAAVTIMIAAPIFHP